MAFRKHGSDLRQGRAGFQLQRGVPKDIQEVIGKCQWKEPGGKTLREAQARVPGFLNRTDQAIAVAGVRPQRSKDELIDAIPQRCDLSDPEVVESLSAGIPVELGDRTMTMAQAERMERIDLASRLKHPLHGPREDRERALAPFLAFAHVSYPTSATSAQGAVTFRTHLHRAREAKAITPGDQWPTQPVEMMVIFRTLLRTGCRLAEVCGLRDERDHWPVHNLWPYPCLGDGPPRL